MASDPKWHQDVGRWHRQKQIKLVREKLVDDAGYIRQREKKKKGKI